jgi:4-hydroxy-tetrahydrodipicolinate synthase
MQQRRLLLEAAVSYRQLHPHFQVMLGTGAPSLDDTIAMTQMAFELGAGAVVVLPPYYYRKVGEEGLYHWFSQVIQQAVPPGAAFLAYHIPGMTGIQLSLDLFSRLKDSFPDRFRGLKDSSGDPDFAAALGRRFGQDLLVFTGNDRLFSLALQHSAAGCITALANLFSPVLRAIWDEVQKQPDLRDEILIEKNQAKLDAARAVSDRYQPAPPFLKAVLAESFGLPWWSCALPLAPFPAELVKQASAELLAGEMLA